jgi:hypothetical protein
MFTACSNKKEKMLMKRWYVGDVRFPALSSDVLKSDTMQGNLIDRQRAALKDIMMKNLYEFKDDGTYITGNAMGTTTGNWKLKSNGILFYGENEKGEEKEKIIPFSHLSDDSLVIQLKNDQTSYQIELLLLPTEQ